MASLMWGVLFSSIGLGYFIYGKKQAMVMPLVCGVALMVFPYFITRVWLLVLLGLLLSALPWLVRH